MAILRVCKCSWTHHIVIQQQEKDGTWICLHNDTLTEDTIEATAFLEKHSILLDQPIEITEQ
jgi:hypothetical protein